MFEKCGLRDIFYRIFVLKWNLIALVVIFAIGGTALYAGYSSIKSSGGGSGTTSQLAYEIKAPIDKNIDANYDPNNAATSARSNFIKTTEGLMQQKSAGKEIYDALLLVYTEDEISKNIGSIGLDWENYYKNLYSLDTETGSTIIVDINAATDEGIAVVTDIIKEKIDSIAATFDNVVVTLTQEAYTESATSADTGFSLSKKMVVAIIIVAIICALLVGLAIAIFNPTINRGSDIDEYDVAFLGIISDNKIEISARIIAKLMQDKGIKTLAIATSLKKNKKENLITSLIEKIDNISKGEIKVVYAKTPTSSGDAFDACLSADAVMFVERRGFSTHKCFAETLSLFSNFEINIIGGLLQ